MYKRYLLLAVIIIIVYFASSCQRISSKNAAISDTALLLGSILTITSFDGGDKDLLAQVFLRVEEIEKLMSTSTKDYETSEILEINKQSMQLGQSAEVKGVTETDEKTVLATGQKSVTDWPSYSISYDLAEVMDTALKVATLTKGAFDPSVAPLVSLWGWPSDTEHLPHAEEIASILPYVSWQGLSMDKDLGILRMREGTSIDVGGIAKGYAANIARDMLLAGGVNRAIIDFGGNIITLGEKPDKSKWNIGIQTPFEQTGEAFLVIKTAAATVVTSGIYERYFEKNGILYSHIIDPRTGYSVDNELVSVSVIGNDSMFADACATGLFVLGLEEGMALANRIASIKAIFVTKDKRVYLSEGIERDAVEIRDESFLLQ